MGSGLAAKRRGSRGRCRARCAHLTAERVRHGPLAPRELRSWVQPAGRRAPSCAPPGCPSAHFHPTSASPAQKDTGRGALRSLPPLPPPEQRLPGRLPSGCNVTQLRWRRLPCSSTGRDASRGQSPGHRAAACESLCVARGTQTPGTRCARRGGPSPCLPGTWAALLAVCTRSGREERD
ncbi:uncharacterized protein LOC113918172 [Zalophus californianus]|uniref:Uncharacterized protein LOC113918172 n=1 Tax=Zalophus californianus TaxID=9704 RepID=A0A6J2CD91_ZALCA|nr:uncharacterized protein LOC113918172 [Zalophus californianus]XP_027957477.1 uncharacterized protein LOC114207695 [Eumetopias jubatus]